MVADRREIPPVVDQMIAMCREVQNLAIVFGSPTDLSAEEALAWMREHLSVPTAAEVLAHARANGKIERWAWELVPQRWVDVRLGGHGLSSPDPATNPNGWQALMSSVPSTLQPGLRLVNEW